MSFENPNEYELVIEMYAAAVRVERAAKVALARAAIEANVAQQARQETWGKVKIMVNEGKIKPGVYRLHKGLDQFADAVLIEEHHDYPEVFPMFR